MHKKRFLINAPMTAEGLPDVTGIDHATLDGYPQSWFDQVAITDNTVTPVTVEDPQGNLVSYDVPVRDDNFVFYPYSLHPAINGRYPSFQILKTAAIVDGHARGLLFIDIADDGQPDDDVAAVFGSLLSQITILAVETDDVWAPDSVTTNERLAVLA